MYLNSVGPHYLETMGARLVAGRQLDLGDARDTPWSVVINETAVQRFFNGQSPIGQRITIGKRDVQVVGVVADSKYDAIRNEVPPTLLASFLQREMFGMHVAVRVSGGLLPMRKAIEDAVHDIDPSMPVSRYRTQRDQINETMGKGPRSGPNRHLPAESRGLSRTLLRCLPRHSPRRALGPPSGCVRDRESQMRCPGCLEAEVASSGRRPFSHHANAPGD
jgi:hypothetical protein